LRPDTGLTDLESPRQLIGRVAGVGPEPDRAAHLILPVNEEVSDAICYSPASAHGVACAQDQRPVVKVSHDGRGIPPRPSSSFPELAAAGRPGLCLIRALRDDVQIRTGATGTLVRFG
jgi:hypothetical protein